MDSFTPYTYIQCPCTDTSTVPRNLGEDRKAEGAETDEDERDFDPRAARASYSLYPLDHLLYCEDCHQIRCPRCVLDEIVTWYCPSCLFEVPSSTVKSEGNRCTRSCFQCPVCIAPLSVNSEAPAPSGLGADQAPQTGPFVLSCSYCNWSSTEIGIKFDKANSIYSQLAKIKNGGTPVVSAKQRRLDREERRRDFSESSIAEETHQELPLDSRETLDAEAQFSNLKSFYQSQLADSTPASALSFGGDYGYGSPGALSRIMGLYTGGSFADKKAKNKNGIMREVCDATEGLQLASTEARSSIAKLQREGWDSTTSYFQRSQQAHDAHFVSELRPVATLLRTKRSKRCRTCRHILSKPESKVQTTRFRIRLVALNYIPSIVIKPLQPVVAGQSQLLSPLKPTQFLLTFKNPLFDAVRVSLATPANTPGRFSSKVTVLCPQFEVGANTDVWDEALREGGGKDADREKRRTRAETNEGQNQAEAGKVWESGRNWVSVVVEVVPALVSTYRGPAFLSEGVERDDSPIKEDEDVLEIPVFIRVEWETDAAHDEHGLGAATTKEKDVKEKRELAYWCVLGVGKIAQDQ
ncbi:dynactin p62 family protein [Phlyctema vagabunda]|uniref:Dynactin subunit 4 n=1 Tax=Phlyctema vagabunda TaxID=108571 RepID=A0ABR4P7U3_9HELO